MINNLTNGMIRLSDEISALRHNRAALTCDLMLGRVNLGKTVAEMITGFQRDRQEMGEKTKAELSESRANLEYTMSEMIADFQRDRQEMGEKTKVEVGEFFSNVKVAVAGLRAGFASDMKRAQKAWSGAPAEETLDRNVSEEGSFPENLGEPENLEVTESPQASGDQIVSEDQLCSEDQIVSEDGSDLQGLRVPGKHLRQAQSKIKRKKKR